MELKCLIVTFLLCGIFAFYQRARASEDSCDVGEKTNAFFEVCRD
jgi:hypothetical protein